MVILAEVGQLEKRIDPTNPTTFKVNHQLHQGLMGKGGAERNCFENGVFLLLKSAHKHSTLVNLFLTNLCIKHSETLNLPC